MKDNWNLSLTGSSVVLVPYAKKFVEKYHMWMTDPYLQEATASEPLSLEEEYAMQLSWRYDAKKCTFIILAIGSDSTDTFQELDSMVGDVNLFMNDYENAFNAEIEVMVADPRYRRRGLASDALKLMIFYGTNQLKLTRFFAKIGENNLASIALFKSLSFREVNYVQVFGEYEYELLPADEGINSLIQEWGACSSTRAYAGHNADESDEADA